MNRRQFLGASGASMLAANAAAQRGQAGGSLPNIVFILTDDLGYGNLGCYGQKQIATPNLDRMAAEGIRFTQAYSGATVCAPSRCNLMTGKHSGHASVRGNKRPELGLNPDEVTMAQMFQRAGYETALFGKWGLGGPGTGSVPNTKGFDHFFGYLDQLHAHNFYPEHLWENQNEVFLTENWFNQRKQYSHDLILERALNFLKGERRKPFFLYLPVTIPHANNELGVYSGDGMEVPSYGQYADRDWPNVEKGFAAQVSLMDKGVGEVLAALKQRGLDDNTLVVFSSDNGPHREGGHNPEFFDDNGPLRGMKRDLYDGGIRVPTLARWPGRIDPGQVSDVVFAFWDLMPTFAELIGAQAPAGIDGQSILPALSGDPSFRRKPLYWEFHERGFKQAVRMGDWKGVRLNPDQPIELYNLKEDIGEKNNIAARHPAVVKEIAELMRSMRHENANFLVKWN